MAHVHEPGNFNKAFALGALLNGAYVLVEASYGFYAGSLALIADAGHNLSDVLSLLLAWGASLLATSKPTAHYTYGFRQQRCAAGEQSTQTMATSCRTRLQCCWVTGVWVPMPL